MEIIREQKPRQLLTETEAALYINMSRPYLRKQRSDKTGLPYIKIGRAIRYDLVDLDEFLKTRKVRPLR